MSSYCNNCENSIWDEKEDSYWCKFHQKYVNDFNICYRHQDIYYDNNKAYSSCYITTAACNICGLRDDNKYLNILRNFRNNVMRNNEKYYGLLILYDIVGPEISKALLKDVSREMVANMIMKYIVIISDYIENKNYDEAVKRYVNLTLTLAGIYNVKIPIINDELISDADIEKSGTGNYVKKIQNKKA
jgi:hypothetical protein